MDAISVSGEIEITPISAFLNNKLQMWLSLDLNF